MKNKIILFVVMMFMMPISILADTIYSIDMKINILEDGSANITEVWVVKADSGSEWYKDMYELNNSDLSNFTVKMDGVDLKFKENWDISENINEKSGYYGINYTENGIELCFGKSDFKRHKFVLNYTLSNYVFNTNDSQVLAWVLFPKTNADYFYADEINALEENLNTINKNTLNMSYGTSPVYNDNGNTMDFIELNRIEGAILDLYDKLTNKSNGRRMFTWNFGMKGDF